MKKEFVKAEVQVIKYSFEDIIVTSPNTPPDGFTEKTATYNDRGFWLNSSWVGEANAFRQIINTEYYLGSHGKIRKGAYAWFNEYDGSVDAIPGISACK